MSSVLGVSVGAGAVRVARPHAGNSAEPRPAGFHTAPDAFDVQGIPVEERRAEELVADAIGAVLAADPQIAATAIAYRDEQHARGIRAELARRQFTNYELVPDVIAALEFLENAGELQGFGTVALYDLGASGLSVTVVDTGSRQICASERTSDISGDYLDSLIREQQIASGRIAHPADPAGLAALDALCRTAKEQLSTSSAVALPSPEGLVLLSQENFEALIMLAVESSARMTRDVILRSEQPVQAVALIGGCAQIPLVARVLRRWLGVPVIVAAAPDTVAARGAVMLARPAHQRPAPAPFPSTFHDDHPAQVRPDPEPAWLGNHSDPDKPNRRREISVAGVAVGALVVVAAIGTTLGWGPQVLEHDSQSKDVATTTAVPTTTSAAPAPTTEAPTTTDPTNDALAVPQPRYQTTTTEAPPTQGPNTITVIPGLPPIVVPTIPPLFPAAPAP
ncbi:Hsp70 family protein [Nocardia huaxiensis]|uniref:Hsp70 family protein n=1 Tax=Nocardia huaxiensis TaxID=2755382 RepID=A0A7D6V987_9NOCA|nr:Hsp70 family protein [Nocardia huaxiensis]QLY30852.1 Hsp70 family protein [Nocardia huaxiensis]UFS94359.1 Hsp70 family protein [Nocardia huaxiensis]